MKKTVILASFAALALGACVLPSIRTAGTGPTLDVAGTADSILKTAVAQTLTAQPAVPSALPSETPTPIVESPVPLTTDSPTSTLTPTVSPTTTVDTATPGPANSTSIPTLELAVVPEISIPTLAILTYGTLPPEIPWSDITLINRSKTQAYISLQVTSIDGRHAVIEYPVVGRIKIRAPLGFYLYVAWVGGNKMVGEFRLHSNEDLSITLFRDQVVIK